MNSDYRRILTYILPYWRRLTLVLALSLVSTLLGLAQPYITKLLIDEALLRKNMQALATVAGLMVVVTVLGFAMNIASSYRYVAVSAAVLFDMRLAVYRHLQRLSPRFYTRTKLGEIVSRLNNDISEVQRVAADTLLAAISNVIFLVGSVAIMLMLNWRLFLLSIVLIPVSIITLKHYRARLSNNVQQMRERSADIGSFLIETLMGMRLVVSSNTQEAEVGRFRRKNQSFVDALLSMQLVSFFAGALPGTVLTLSTALVFLYGGKLVIDGAMTIGALVAFMAYHMRLLAPVQNLMGLYTSVTTARVSLNRVFEILDTPIDVNEATAAVAIENVKGDIEFENVSLKYDRETVVLDAVSFKLPAGSLCAIAGPSGVGKSTVADLLLRFYDPQAGSVRLDGVDLRELRLADLRREVVMVEQTAFLFNATVAENIRYGRPDATREEIIRAAQAASIDGFIQSLPEGYETQVGERGEALSTGERQRIALARALLRDPAVLVLDEPTASVDPITEQTIAAALRSATKGRTTVVISHRLSLIELADWVVVIDNGKVVETGTPAELLVRGTALAGLFSFDRRKEGDPSESVGSASPMTLI
ncbi:MAG TPA: ABC transporter ATP-binding protein [Blastocatellia bacterium]|nr:ABC transporter ATP-binding protein [Blastocatellia bacterium]